MSVVTFCGHNEAGIGEEIRQMLYRTVEQEIQNGADLFYLGGYGHFDRMAAGALWELKKKYAHIKSVLVLAYLNREVDMRYYDETTYPPLENTPLRRRSDLPKESINASSTSRRDRCLKSPYFSDTARF